MKGFAQREAESKKMLDKYTDKLPIYLQSKSINLGKNKWLVPRNITSIELIGFLRKKISIKEHQSIFLYINTLDSKDNIVNSVLPVPTESMEDVYYNNKNDDGFLYISVELETTFGARVEFCEKC